MERRDRRRGFALTTPTIAAKRFVCSSPSDGIRGRDIPRIVLTSSSISIKLDAARTVQRRNSSSRYLIAISWPGVSRGVGGRSSGQRIPTLAEREKTTIGSRRDGQRG